MENLHNKPEQEPVAIQYASKAERDLYEMEDEDDTTPPQRKPLDFGDFFEWANDEGYDTAHTHDGVKWVCLNPMTADLWKTWQAAHGIKE